MGKLVLLLTVCRNFLNRSSWLTLEEGESVFGDDLRLDDEPFVVLSFVANAARPFTCCFPNSEFVLCSTGFVAAAEILI